MNDLRSELLAETNDKLSELLYETDVEIRRLGWKVKKGREALRKTTGKISRRLCTEEELSDFLAHLKKQPTPE